MALCGCSFLLILLALSLSVIVSGDTDLIQKTCQSTNYNELCVTSLESDPNSFAADVPGLAIIIVNRALTSSLNASSYTSKLLRNATAADPLLKRAIKQCTNCYNNTNTALERSLEALASSETYDYASLHVSAAMEYPGLCKDMFKRNARLVYPLELGRREEAVQHLCEIAMGIINLLLSSTSP